MPIVLPDGYVLTLTDQTCTPVRSPGSSFPLTSARKLVSPGQSLLWKATCVGGVLLSTLFLVAGNFLADLLLYWVDPRIRAEASGR